jgi:hypothetical protein
MRKPYQLMFLLLGVLMIALPIAALAQDMEEMTNGMPEYRQFVSKASRLRTSDVNDPDTVWIGHIGDATWRPRDRNGNILGNASIQTGGYGPYRVGRGDYRPGIGPGTHYNGVWDWDHFGAATPAQGSFPARGVESDSLMGWWPLARPFQSGDGVNPDDKVRPFYGLDYGNQGNYVLNQGSPKRTFGVTGYWHRDVGRNSLPLADSVGGVPTVGGIGGVVPGPNVEWKPIGGGASAWCGLRAAGDATHIDPVTGNAYNQTVLSYRGNNSFFQAGSQRTTGTDQNFPGYGSQWDQMLYQDITLSSNAAVNVQFDYATAMSRVRGGTATQRVGYFYKDPTKTVAGNDNNYISATDAEATLGGPVDSFMVYVGRPVNDALCRFADGTIGSVYDPARRWFSEVLALDGSGGLSQVSEILSQAGVNGTMAGDGTITPVHANVSLSTSQLTAMGVGAGGGTVRLVFRVKTNRGSDDEDYGAAAAFTSNTRGAAIVDNVTVTQGGGNLVAGGDFEGSMNAAWKSTGKPPGVYVHVHSVDPSLGSQAAPWNDPCSPPNFADPAAANRGCNMISNVLTGGDHDNAEKPGGLFGGPTQDRARWAASPTINLKSTGPGDYNAQGIDAEIADATDWNVQWDYHSPGFRGNVNGNFFSVGMQSYPARQANGLTCWGEARHTLTINFQSVNACLTTFSSPKTNGLILTTNANGIPDSIRVYFQFLSRCFTAVHDANTCSPVSPSVLTGNHVDNLTFALIDVPPPAGLAVSPWFKYSDAFPATTTTNFTPANFDTCAAWIKSGFNAHVANIGLTKPSVQGDSAWVQTGIISGGGRVDMVFRVLPGVGNYVQMGNRSSGLRRIPTSATQATSADAGNGALSATQRFWGAYMADNGAFGTGGNGTTGPGHAGNQWDPNKWNSARMDTLETNVFPCLNISLNIATLDPSQWMTTYHEADPKYTILGSSKNRCFVVDPSVGRGTACASKTSTSVTQCNLICGTHPNSATFPPLWTQDLTSGLPASENGLPNGRTYEYTKIIPDGMLTPGAHVQYFFRRSPGQSAPVDMLPDTNFVFNGFADAARWYHFSVLPDRWKDPAFPYGGVGMACMLVDDVHDRTFDELFWVSVADSIGLTAANKRGAHNGWKARGDQDVILNRDNGEIGQNDALGMAVRANGGQPGSYWDLWNTTAGESQTTGAAWLANRSAAQPGAGQLTENKGTRTGPTGDMLRNWYKTLVFLTGSITTNFFGRVPNRTDDDMAMLNDFVNPALPGTATPRNVFVWGAGFCEDLTVTGGPSGGTAFLNSFFGASLRSPAYRTFAANSKQVSNYDPAAGSALDVAGGAFGLSGMKFGLSDGCGLENDVLAVNVAVPTAVAQVLHENVGAAGPYVSGIYAPNGGTRAHVTYLDGTRIQRVGGIISYNPVSGAPVLPVSNAGLRAYMYKALSIMAGSATCGPQGAPVGVGDGNQNPSGTAFINFLNLRSSNPMHSGQARIAFGLAKTDRVKISVYDVTGRLVKTLADRTFVGGQEHLVIWDGSSDAGQKVKSGVYFYQLKTNTWTSQKKLAVLAN